MLRSDRLYSVEGEADDTSYKGHVWYPLDARITLIRRQYQIVTQRRPLPLQLQPKMTYSTATIINITFIPLYFPLFVLNILNLIQHRPIRTSGFLPLLIVSVLHLAGNLILVIAVTRSIPSVVLRVWGFTLQSIGLSPMILAVLSFYAKARALLGKEDTRGEKIAARVLHLLNLAAMVCIITGYTNTKLTDDSNGTPLAHPVLPVQTKIGAVLYILLTTTLLAIAAFGLKPITRPTRIIQRALLVSTPLMIIRSCYSTYTIFSGSLLVVKSIWAKFVLQYLSEFVALAVLTWLGLVIKRQERMEEEEVVVVGGEDAGSVTRKDVYSMGERTQQSGKDTRHW